MPPSRELRPYVPGDAAACAALYEEAFRAVPTFVPVDAATVHRGLTAPESAHDDLEEPRALVGEDGFVAFCRRRPKEAPDAPWHGSVFAVACRQDRPDFATGLVRAAIGAFAAEGIGDVAVLQGSGGFRFLNGGDGGLPESLAHLAGPVMRAGVELVGRNLLFAGPVDPAMASPRTGAEIVVADPRYPCSCRAIVDGRPVGECWTALGRDLNGHPAAGAVAHLAWIGVEEPYRRRGIARQMLAWSFRELHGRGVRRLSLTTSPGNLAAQAFYYRAGLRVVDQLLGFRTREHAGGMERAIVSA